MVKWRANRARITRPVIQFRCHLKGGPREVLINEFLGLGSPRWFLITEGFLLQGVPYCKGSLRTKGPLLQGVPCYKGFLITRGLLLQ